jgi:hypothetical protein
MANFDYNVARRMKPLRNGRVRFGRVRFDGGTNGLVERRQLDAVAKIVEPLVRALPVRERIAVGVAVKNMHAGTQVFRNPRFPATQEQDYRRARDLLMPSFSRHGLIEKPAMVRRA